MPVANVDVQLSIEGAPQTGARTDSFGVVRGVSFRRGQQDLQASILGFALFSRIVDIEINTSRLMVPLEVGRVSDPAPYRLQIDAAAVVRGHTGAWIRIVHLFSGSTEVAALDDNGRSSFWGEFYETNLITIFDANGSFHSETITLRAADQQVVLPAPRKVADPKSGSKRR
jgi:hypothetical protein